MLSTAEIQKLQSLLTGNDERLPIVFNALGDPKRCKIFRSFLTSDRLCVSDVSKIFKISMSSASQHLKILEITKLVKKEKEGRTAYFKPNIDDELVRSIIKAVK